MKQIVLYHDLAPISPPFREKLEINLKVGAIRTDTSLVAEKLKLEFQKLELQKQEMEFKKLK